jgi:hypothetical protein
MYEETILLRSEYVSMISHIYEKDFADKCLALPAHLLPRYNIYNPNGFCFRTPKREMTSSTLSMRMDRTIIEGLHDIVSVLEDHLKPLVQVRHLSGDPKMFEDPTSEKQIFKTYLLIVTNCIHFTIQIKVCTYL